jgi:hypothetical protein
VAVGLRFEPTVDITGIGTLALAMVTVGAVVVGGLALKDAEGQIDVSRKQVAESHRPVVVGVADTARVIPEALGSGGVVIPRGRKVRAHPYMLQLPGPTGTYPQLAKIAQSVLVVPIENIGSWTCARHIRTGV